MRLSSLAGPFGLALCFVLVATCSFGCRHDDAISAQGASQPGVPAPTSDGELTGKWVIDLNRSAKPPKDVEAEANKVAAASYILFAKDGTYKESMSDLNMSGTYKVQGVKVSLTSTQPPNQGPADVADLDRKEGTLTFSPGPNRVVFVRAKA